MVRYQFCDLRNTEERVRVSRWTDGTGDFAIELRKEGVKLSDFAEKTSYWVEPYWDWSPTWHERACLFVNRDEGVRNWTSECLASASTASGSPPPPPHKALAEKKGIKYSLLGRMFIRGSAGEIRRVSVRQRHYGRGGDRHREQRPEEVAWFKEIYTFAVVPDLKAVSAALGQLTAATA